MATTTETVRPEDVVPETFWATLPARLQEFLWLSSGMFSAAALFLAFLGYFTLNASANAAQHFAAAVVSAVLFGICTMLKLGPDSA